ncbi:MAG: ribosome biogenesis GTPase Der [Rhodospirillales bacterium]|nr:ribosome biogenesis GTPase Der [Rhodospirillales bacterium]
MSSFTVAIVGRPNVGKSTLFNRLTGKRVAIVDPAPGVTRDRREGEGSIGPLTFQVVDTAGLEEAEPGTVAHRMRIQTDRALDEADLLLFVIDARAGVTPDDEHFARELRRTGTPIVLVANKAEARVADAGFYDAFSLGTGDPVPFSAEHGEGMGDLYQAVAPYAEAAEEESDAAAEGPLRLAIVGRPNVGKSTLVNHLLGEDRMITGPEPGLTRDAIAARWSFEGQAIELVDTAGMRRKARVREQVEKLSVSDSLNAIQFAHVVVVMLDAGQAFDKQDLAIADLVDREGRSIVVAINKWDLVKDQVAMRREFELRLGELLPQIRGVPLVTLSALNGRGTKRLMPAVVESYGHWNRRIGTADLNRWLEDAVSAHPPPVVRGGRVKLRYATQGKSRPPTFTVFGTRVSDLPDSYRRYLINRLRDDFDLPGTPLRLRFKAPKNPYAERS